MAAQVTVTVNGMSVEKYLGKEKSNEIQDFIRSEVRMWGRVARRSITSSNGNRNTTTARQDGDRVRLS